MIVYRRCRFVDEANTSTIEFPTMMSVRLCRFVADVDFDAVAFDHDNEFGMVNRQVVELSAGVVLNEVFLKFCIYATGYNYF